MKFDTPATTNPIDQLKVVGKPTDRIDGPLKTTGTAPYAYERHDVVPNQAYGYVVGAAIAKGRIVVDRPRRCEGRARRARHRHRRERRQARQGQAQHREAARRPGDPALSPGDRAWWWRRPSSRRAPRRSSSASTTRRRRARSTSRRRRTSAQAKPRSPAVPPDTRGRRLRRRLRGRAGPARRDLHHARPERTR